MAGAQNPPAADKRRVYLAGRAIFTGDKALLKKKKKVTKVITDNRAVLRPLIRDLGEDKVVEIVRDLLDRKVFKEELCAKIEFPELFQSSPNQEIQREASEVDAARSVSEAIHEIASVEEGEIDNTDEEPGEATVVVNGNSGGLGVTNGSRSLPESSNGPRDSTSRSNSHPPEKPAQLPNLYPIYIPYKAQHLILNEAQRLLEESCFEFLQKWLPSILEEHGWECASAIELTKSTLLISKHATTTTDIPEEAFHNIKPEATNVVRNPDSNTASTETPLTRILMATNALRHSAVHRLPNTARGVRDLCRHGQDLAAALGDSARAAQLERVCEELDHMVEAMRLNKNALEGAAAAGLAEIQRRREELDRQEREIIARMVREDRENKASMGVLLEGSVGRILMAEKEGGVLEDIDEEEGAEEELGEEQEREQEEQDDEKEKEKENENENENDDDGNEMDEQVEEGALLVEKAEPAEVKDSNATKELWFPNVSWNPAWRKEVVRF